MFVAKYNAEGLLLWAKQAGGHAGANGLGDLGLGIGLDASGNSYVTGYFEAAAIFGTGEAGETTLISAGASDIFVARYGPGSPTTVAQTPGIIDDFQLAQNYPNPFNPATTIAFEVPEAMQITLVVYNLRGQLVRTLFSREALPGRQQVTWDGTDNKGGT